MTDVFIRTTKANLADPLRAAFFDATVARWQKDPEAQVHVIQDQGTREARWQAEQEAASDPYIFTDDDVVIHGKDWVKRGREVVLGHPEYACCSTLSLVETENIAKPLNGELIYPMHAVGAPMWVRKGVLKGLLEKPEPWEFSQECFTIWNYVLGLGRQEGLISGLRHMHLGYGFSSNPNLHSGY